jgi:hypothetical protein
MFFVTNINSFIQINLRTKIHIVHIYEHARKVRIFHSVNLYIYIDIYIYNCYLQQFTVQYIYVHGKFFFSLDECTYFIKNIFLVSTSLPGLQCSKLL